MRSSPALMAARTTCAFSNLVMTGDVPAGAIVNDRQRPPPGTYHAPDEFHPDQDAPLHARWFFGRP
jgi:hypothetical protein